MLTHGVRIDDAPRRSLTLECGRCGRAFELWDDTAAELHEHPYERIGDSFRALQVTFARLGSTAAEFSRRVREAFGRCGR